MLKEYQKSVPEQAAHTSRDPWIRLANGVILQAVKDYRLAKKALADESWKERLKDAGPAERKRILKQQDAYIYTAEECERFFRSEYFMLLTDTDGTELLRKLVTE